jgi:hypothetical protein
MFGQRIANTTDVIPSPNLPIYLVAGSYLTRREENSGWRITLNQEEFPLRFR